MIKNLPAIHWWRNDIKEKVADYYAEYKTNKMFSLTNPSLYIWFRDKENELII